MTIRTAIALLACLIAFTGLAACGNDGNDETTSPTATTTATETTTGGDTTTGATSTGTSTAAEDPITALFFRTIHQTVRKKGLSEEAAQCIEDKLRASITPEEIDQIKSGQRPPSLRAKATAAGKECGQEFGGSGSAG